MLVYNKIDLMENTQSKIDRDREENVAVWLSALTGAGIELLLQAIVERLPRKLCIKSCNYAPIKGLSSLANIRL